MDLRLCMFEPRRRYGATFLHIAAPAVIWTYVSAYLSVAGEVDEANVPVARVSCVLRVSAAARAETVVLCLVRVTCTFCPAVVRKHEENLVLEDAMWLWLEFRAYGGLCGGRGGLLAIYAWLESRAHFAQNSYKTQGKRSV